MVTAQFPLGQISQTLAYNSNSIMPVTQMLSSGSQPFFPEGPPACDKPGPPIQTPLACIDEVMQRMK